MEQRKITVVATSSQRKSVIMSSATTLAELKRDLRENGISYEGMTFFEGLTKTELKSDDSFLPKDVAYKGSVTNELVFMLTNTQKKIKSGTMTRQEAYVKIKELGLQQEVKEAFGKNFTQVSTDDLISIITFHLENKNKEKSQSSDEDIDVSQSSCYDCVDNAARAGMMALLDIMYNNDFIDEEEKGTVIEAMEQGGNFVMATPSQSQSSHFEPKDESSYSDDEIQKMMMGCGI